MRSESTPITAEFSTVHINIDTQTDDPVTLYRMGRWLIQTYETYAPADEPRAVHNETVTVHVDASEIQNIIDGLGRESVGYKEPTDAEFTSMPASAPPPPPPAVPVSNEAEWGDAELNADTDDSGTVTGLTASVSLPPGIPAPPAVLNTETVAATVVPPAIPAAPGAAAELDKRGIPWDGRIHAANRARKLDGSWKNKRGVDAAIIAQIEGIPAAEAPSTPLATAAPPPPPAAPAVPPAPSAPPPPPPTAGSAAPAAGAPVTGFRELMGKIGKLNPDQVVALLLPFGLKPEDMLDLVGNVALIASVNAAVDKLA